MNSVLSQTTSKLDWLGIVLSGVCAVHCLLVPIILPALVVLNLNFIASEAFEHWAWNITFGLCLLITIFQFAFKHKHASVFIPLTIGFGLMMNKEAFGESAEPYVAFLVGGFLVLTHILNLKLCESCPKCNPSEMKLR